jgi:hypothetical protein
MGTAARVCKRSPGPENNETMPHPMSCEHRKSARAARILRAASGLLALALLGTPGSRAAEDDSAAVNVYMAGAEVRIDRAIDGDLVAAAGRIHIDQPVAGDAVLGAGSIDIQAAVGEDLRAAGGIITLAAPVHREVLLVAGRIILTPAADVRGETWLAAASVTLGGRLVSAAKVYARDITVTGESYGPLELSADRIEIGDGARVLGDITYSSASEIRIHPLAKVEGKVIRSPAKLDVNEPATIPGLKPLRPLLVVVLFAFGMLLIAACPRFVYGSVRTLAAVPSKSLALGTALFFSVPPVAVLLVITIIGIPVGLALLLAYALGLAGGYIVTALFIAARLARLVQGRALTGWRQYAFMAAALLLLALVTSIPYVGALILLLVCAGGLGAVVLQRFSRQHAAAAPDAGADTWPAA